MCKSFPSLQKAEWLFEFVAIQTISNKTGRFRATGRVAKAGINRTLKKYNFYPIQKIDIQTSDDSNMQNEHPNLYLELCCMETGDWQMRTCVWDGGGKKDHQVRVETPLNSVLKRFLNRLLRWSLRYLVTLSSP